METRSFAMTGVVIASGSEAIQLVVQEKAGLPRRCAPRNDGVGTRLFAITLLLSYDDKFYDTLNG